MNKEQTKILENVEKMCKNWGGGGHWGDGAKVYVFFGPDDQEPLPLLRAQPQARLSLLPTP
eukprot:180284-Amphidinium_carterae.1